jgi:Holliday junction resolvase
MNNKRTGNKFEREFADYLKSQGYWVHLLTPNQNGQPADLIAMKDGISHLIDCKVCANGNFKLSRIEDNQWTAMGQFEKHSGKYGRSHFALKIKNGEVYIISYSRMVDFKKNNIKSLGLSDIPIMGTLLYEGRSNE